MPIEQSTPVQSIPIHMAPPMPIPTVPAIPFPTAPVMQVPTVPPMPIPTAPPMEYVPNQGIGGPGYYAPNFQTHI